MKRPHVESFLSEEELQVLNFARGNLSYARKVVQYEQHRVRKFLKLGYQRRLREEKRNG